MPHPLTRWRVRPPLLPGEGWSAVEFDPATQVVIGTVKFEQNGRAQATKWVASQNSDKDIREKVGGNLLRDLLKSEAHKNVRKDDGNQ